MPLKRDKFDFEIGYLFESPCRQCLYRDCLPECHETCKVIDEIRDLLARGVSCTGPYFFQQ